MEELLPLIIGIAWLVYTIYNKNKKKEAKKQHPVSGGEESAPSIIEQLFTGVTVPEQPYKEYDEPFEDGVDEEYDEVVIEPKENPSPFLITELADFAEEGQAAFTRLDNVMMEDDLNEEDQFEKEDFELRKAIIFSEILNAPYIGYK